MGKTIHTGAGQIWVEDRGQGPNVLLIAGLGDSVEAWHLQLDGLADRHRWNAVCAAQVQCAERGGVTSI